MARRSRCSRSVACSQTTYSSARRRELSWVGIAKIAAGVVTNPIVGAILAGTEFGFTGATLPAVIDRTLALIAQAAVPLSLVALAGTIAASLVISTALAAATTPLLVALMAAG